MLQFNPDQEATEAWSSIASGKAGKEADLLNLAMSRKISDKVALLILREKVLRTFYEYQFLYNRTEYAAKEILDDKGRMIAGKLEFQQCPYVAAMQDIPAKIRPRRETFCRYDCQGTFHDEFCTFIGFRIRMEPNGAGCVWHIDAPEDLKPED
jgi:hypothetical protein